MQEQDFFIFLKSKSKEVVDKWFEVVIRTYPHEAASFFLDQKDEFLNPVGSILKKELKNIWGELLEEQSSNRLKEYIDAIVRVRAVQDFSPSGALIIFKKLKDLIRDMFSKNIEENLWQRQLRDFEDKIDQLMLLAFDIYMKCREKLWELKVKEAYANVRNIIRLAGIRVKEEKS